MAMSPAGRSPYAGPRSFQRGEILRELCNE
jgi:hypothetical protein